MSELQTDEKLCPFCAETIKAAAVKCRWCGSELPDAAPADAASTPLVPAPGSPPDREPEVRPTEHLDGPPAGRPTRRRFGRRSRGDGIVPTSASRQRVAGPSRLPLLVALLLVSIAAVAFAVVRADADETAPDGTVTSNSARAVAMQRLAESTAKVLSYKAETFDSDAEASGRLMTATMRAEYLKALTPAKTAVVKNGITLKATVVETSLIKQSAESVRGLLFVNQVTTATGSTNEQLDNNRVVVTMQRSGDRWLISKMDAF